MSTLETIVVGAGIVGVSSAIWLKRAGHDVTLIGTGTTGLGATYGSGLRCAGADELGGLEAGSSNPPINLLRRKVRETFPNMTADSVEECVPLIGEIENSGVCATLGITISA